MTELQPSNELSQRMTYAKALAASDLLPRQYRNQPANVLVAIEYGRAIGIEPMAAIQGIHVVEGKPTASAQLIGALVRMAGHRLRVTGDSTHARAEITRSDDQEFTFVSEWNLERAQASGLIGKGTWKQYPDAMLKARAITEVARDACPEVLAGVAYTAEELGADSPTEPSPAPIEVFGYPKAEPAFKPEVAEMLAEAGITVERSPESHADVQDAEIVEQDSSEPDKYLTEPAWASHGYYVPSGKYKTVGNHLASEKQLDAITNSFMRHARQCGVNISRENLLEVLSDALGLDVILEDIAQLTKGQAGAILDDILKNNWEKCGVAFEAMLDRREADYSDEDVDADA